MRKNTSRIRIILPKVGEGGGGGGVSVHEVGSYLLSF